MNAGLRLPGLTALLLLAACDQKPQKPPAPAPAGPADVLLEVEGHRFTRGEIDEHVAYLRSYAPDLGRITCQREVLDQLLIPLAYARVEFRTQRQALRERAEGLRRALGAEAGVSDLLSRTGKDYPGFVRFEQASRPELMIPEQRFLFDIHNLRRVSPVIELPLGFSLGASETLIPSGPTEAYLKADLILVRYSHFADAEARGRWFKALRQRLRELAPEKILVHPDLRDALPTYLVRRGHKYARPAQTPR